MAAEQLIIPQQRIYQAAEFIISGIALRLGEGGKKCDSFATNADYCKYDSTIAAAAEVFCVEGLGPAGVVKRLGYYLAGCFGSLQFDQNERAVGSQCKKVDAAAMAGVLLAAADHLLR